MAAFNCTPKSCKKERSYTLPSIVVSKKRAVENGQPTISNIPTLRTKSDLYGSASSRRKAICVSSKYAGTAGTLTEENFFEAFALVTDSNVKNRKDAAEVVREIKQNFSGSPEEWEKRIKALKLIRNLMKHPASIDAFWDDCKPLELKIQSCLKGLRSQLVREACITIAFLAVSLQEKFARVAEALLQDIVQLVQSHAKVIATSAKICLEFIVKYTRSGRLLPVLLMCKESKSREVRACCYNLALLIIQFWDVKELANHLAALKCFIVEALNDADPSSRLAGRAAYAKFVSLFPAQRENLFNSLDLVKQRQLTAYMASLPECDANVVQSTLAYNANETVEALRGHSNPTVSEGSCELSEPSNIDEEKYEANVSKDSCLPIEMTTSLPSLSFISSQTTPSDHQMVEAVGTLIRFDETHLESSTLAKEETTEPKKVCLLDMSLTPPTKMAPLPLEQNLKLNTFNAPLIITGSNCFCSSCKGEAVASAVDSTESELDESELSLMCKSFCLTFQPDALTASTCETVSEIPKMTCSLTISSCQSVAFSSEEEEKSIENENFEDSFVTAYDGSLDEVTDVSSSKKDASIRVISDKLDLEEAKELLLLFKYEEDRGASIGARQLILRSIANDVFQASTMKEIGDSLLSEMASNNVPLRLESFELHLHLLWSSESYCSLMLPKTLSHLIYARRTLLMRDVKWPDNEQWLIFALLVVLLRGEEEAKFRLKKAAISTLVERLRDFQADCEYRAESADFLRFLIINVGHKIFQTNNDLVEYATILVQGIAHDAIMKMWYLALFFDLHTKVYSVKCLRNRLAGKLKADAENKYKKFVKNLIFTLLKCNVYPEALQ